MKIAINTRFLLSDRLEGIGWYTHEIVRRWTMNHPENEYHFFFDRAYDERFIYNSKNIQAHVLHPPARHPFLWWLWFEWSVNQKLKSLKPDVFFSPDGYLSISASTPTLLSCHDIAWKHYPHHVPWLVQKYYEFYVPKYLKKAQKITTVSSFVKNDISRAFGLEPEKTFVAYNGVKEKYVPVDNATKEKIKKKYSDGKEYFLFVGALHPRKNVHRLLRAFDVFKSETLSDVQLVVVGNMSWKTGEIKKTLAQSAYKKDIHFLGFLGQEALSLVTASAFALCYPSLNEGFGVPIAEAMYCDVPVITSDCSSMPEVAGDAALLVDPESVESIARAMTKLINEPDLVQKLIARGREQRQKFDWDATADLIYDELVRLAREYK